MYTAISGSARRRLHFKRRFEQLLLLSSVCGVQLLSVRAVASYRNGADSSSVDEHSLRQRTHLLLSRCVPL